MVREQLAAARHQAIRRSWPRWARSRASASCRPDLIERAYADGALAIGGGQTISQPYIVARMTESRSEAHRPGRQPGGATAAASPRDRHRLGLPGGDPGPDGRDRGDHRARRQRWPRRHASDSPSWATPTCWSRSAMAAPAGRPCAPYDGDPGRRRLPGSAGTTARRAGRRRTTRGPGRQPRPPGADGHPACRPAARDRRCWSRASSCRSSGGSASQPDFAGDTRTYVRSPGGRKR